MKNKQINTKALLLISIVATIFNISASTIDQRPYNQRHKRVLDVKKKITLADKGIALADIIVPEHCFPSTLFAAETLKAYLDKSTGGNFKIIKSKSFQSKPIPVRKRTSIFIGDSPWTRAFTGIDFASLPRDAYVIKAINNVIIIAGRDDMHFSPAKELDKRCSSDHLYEHATLNGVYDFLESFLGIRFIFPVEEFTVIPKHTNLAVPTMDIEEAPDFARRFPRWSTAHLGNTPWKTAKEKNYGRSIYTLQNRQETHCVPNCHGLQKLALPNRFFKKRPDFFALDKKGKRSNKHLCYSSKGLEDEVFKDAKSYLSGEVASIRGVKRWNGVGLETGWCSSTFLPGYFNIMPPDGMKPCLCDKCRPYYERNRISDLVFGFAKRVAQRLLDEGVKGEITVMAYSAYQKPPSFELPSNMSVMFATLGPWEQDHQNEGRNQGESYNAGEINFGGNTESLIEEWVKKNHGKKITLWNYMMEDCLGLVPQGSIPMSPMRIGCYYKNLSNSIDGAFVQFSNTNILKQYLNMYVFNRVAWNTATDVKELLRDHHQKLFGPGEAPMARFYQYLEQIWIEKLIPKTQNTPLGPAAVKPSLVDIWENAYDEASINMLDNYLKEAEKLTMNNADCLKRVQFIRKHLFKPLCTERQAYIDQRRDIDDLNLVVPFLDPGKITLNGKLDEPAWAQAKEINLKPLEKDIHSLNSKVRLFATENKLFIAFICDEPQTENMRLDAQRNDDPNNPVYADSCVEIFLKQSNERRRANYLHMVINANGVVADKHVFLKGSSDKNWDSCIKKGTFIDKNKSYIIELALPIGKWLGKNIKSGDTFLANFCRERHLKHKNSKNVASLYSWSPYLRMDHGGFHDVEKFGTLHFGEKKKGESIIRNGNFEDKSRKLSLNILPVEWGTWCVPSAKQQNVSVVEQENEQYGKCISISNNILNIPIQKNGTGIRITVTQDFPSGTLTFKPNTKYAFTFRIKTQNIKSVYPGNRNGAFIGVNSGSGWIFFPRANVYKGNIPWIKQGFSFKTNNSISSANSTNKPCIWLCLWNSSGTVWFDDLHIYEIK